MKKKFLLCFFMLRIKLNQSKGKRIYGGRLCGENHSIDFLSATEFTIPWWTIIRHGGCHVCVSLCPRANFATG